MLAKRGERPLALLVGLPTQAGSPEAMISPTLRRAGVVATPLPLLDFEGERGVGHKASFFLYADLSPTGVSTPYPDNLAAV